MRRFLPGAVGLCLVLSAPGAAPAQEEHESSVPGRETREAAHAVKAARGSRGLVEGAPVTYEQVLANPDDVDLNYRYARTQIARGDLKGSAATLERLLLLDPSLDRVRLLYAVVLFRLDNLDEAEQAFLKISRAKIGPALLQEVEEYLLQIRLRRKRTRTAASVSVGYQYDTNRNAAPSAKQRLLGDAPLGLTGTSRRRPDTSVIGIQGLRVTHDLGLQAGHQLFGSLNHYIAEQTAADDLDLQSLSAEAGGRFPVGPVTVTPSGFFDHILLSRETFVRAQGFDLLVERQATARLNLLADLRWSWEDYVPVTENLAAPEREGASTVWTLGGSYVLSPTMRLGLSGSVTDKNAKARYNQYDGTSLQAVHTWLMGKGQFLTSSFAFGVNVYDRADTAISAKTRRDEQYRFRLTYGVPVDLITRQKLPRAWVRDWILTFMVEQFRSDSNIVNYTYSNTKTAVMLTRNFEF